MKICKICNISKEVECFGKKEGSKDGLDYYCKSCRSDYYKSRKYDRKEYQSSYKRKKSDKRTEYLKNYLKNWKDKNKKDIIIRALLKRVSSCKNQHKIKEVYNILRWSKEDFIERFGDIKKGFHLDHKIPVSWFIEDSPIYIINNLDNLHVLPSKINLSKGNRYFNPVSEEFLNKALIYIKPQYQECFNQNG